MFSHKDLPLDSETLEYAWLLEVTIGDITGRLTAPQVNIPYLADCCSEFGFVLMIKIKYYNKIHEHQNCKFQNQNHKIVTL